MDIMAISSSLISYDANINLIIFQFLQLNSDRSVYINRSKYFITELPKNISKTELYVYLKNF